MSAHKEKKIFYNLNFLLLLICFKPLLHNQFIDQRYEDIHFLNKVFEHNHCSFNITKAYKATLILLQISLLSNTLT